MGISICLPKRMIHTLDGAIVGIYFPCTTWCCPSHYNHVLPNIIFELQKLVWRLSEEV